MFVFPDRYWHICLITRVPVFSPNVIVMALEDVDAVEMVKLFVGYGIRVRKALFDSRCRLNLSFLLHRVLG